MAGALVASVAGTTLSYRAAASGSGTTWHFAVNGNFDNAGNFAPGADGFTLADVGTSASQTDGLPAGVEGLVYIGSCSGADSSFTSAIAPLIGNPKVFGFYLVDEPDPTGQYHPLCTAANLKAESDWIHTHDPGPKTFITLMNMAGSDSPSFAGTYTPTNSGVDLYGVDPYPCRTELTSCDFAMINRYVTAVEAAGVPEADIVPVFQAFGGGSYPDDGGGHYRLPTVAEEGQILSTWAPLIPSPVFDYAYSWGSQSGDTALSGSPALQQVFAAHNAAGPPPTSTSSSVPPTSTSSSVPPTSTSSSVPPTSTSSSVPPTSTSSSVPPTSTSSSV
ncbi:MAG TPA: hypothetical protein VGN54_14075, partial [Mycobacteriales bacterium]|nr:hypothetical protein [Mycobacteriales bacterium]